MTIALVVAMTFLRARLCSILPVLIIVSTMFAGFAIPIRLPSILRLTTSTFILPTNSLKPIHGHIDRVEESEGWLYLTFSGE